ncbi:MAG: hypothetical protein ACNA8L_04080 [Luteolibacter sp.]
MHFHSNDPTFVELPEHDEHARASVASSGGRSGRLVDDEAVWVQVEVLIRAVLAKPPPSSSTVDPDWARLFLFCEKHREVLAARVRSRRKIANPGLLDLWLRQLVSPPPGIWGGVRLGLLPLIRAAGIPPRSEFEPMFRDFPNG